jgi:hypothetical protein
MGPDPENESGIWDYEAWRHEVDQILKADPGYLEFLDSVEYRNAQEDYFDADIYGY